MLARIRAGWLSSVTIGEQSLSIIDFKRPQPILIPIAIRYPLLGGQSGCIQPEFPTCGCPHKIGLTHIKYWLNKYLYYDTIAHNTWTGGRAGR